MTLVPCAECGRSVSVHSESCVHCGAPVVLPDDAAESDSAVSPGLLRYSAYPRPLARILLLTFLLGVVETLIARQFVWPVPVNQALFALYMTMFVAYLAVYFASRRPKGEDPAWRRVQSLRRLLGETSRQWSDSRGHFSGELEDAFRQKSSTSMAVTALLMAVVILVLQQASSVLLSRWGSLSPGGAVLLVSTVVVSIFSFVCFIIAIDAMDIVFNRFGAEEDQRRIVTFYYLNTINPRYFGLMGMLFALVFFVAFHSVALGSVTLAIIMSVGYYHWYPPVSAGDEAPTTKSLYGGSLNVIAKAAFVLAPLAVWYVTQ